MLGQLRVRVLFQHCCDGWMDGWTHSSLCWGPCFSAWSSSMCTATEKRFQKAGSRTPAIVDVDVVGVVIVLAFGQFVVVLRLDVRRLVVVM